MSDTFIGIVIGVNIGLVIGVVAFASGVIIGLNKVGKL